MMPPNGPAVGRRRYDRRRRELSNKGIDCVRCRAGISRGVCRRCGKGLDTVRQRAGGVAPVAARTYCRCSKNCLSVIDCYRAIGFRGADQSDRVVSVADIVGDNRGRWRGRIYLWTVLNQAGEREVGGIASAITDDRGIEVDRGRRRGWLCSAQRPPRNRTRARSRLSAVAA